MTPALLLPIGLVACRGPETPPPPFSPSGARPHPDIVLVTLDTTRADRIGCYGYAEATTPTLDRLCRAGRRYDQAISPVPLTIPAHASIFTGRYPAELGVRRNGDGVLAAGAVTLAEHLGAQGYATGASVAAFVTTRLWGFGQGFDAYMDLIPSKGNGIWQGQRRGEAVIDDALTWLRQTGDDTPRFLWVHLYDAHFPFQPVEPHKSLHAGRPYDGEISYMDGQIGRLLDEGFADREPLVVVVGDHGESLGEHHELTHGLFAYQATQRVPFILAGPGVSPETRAAPVGLIDVAPVLLDAAGLPPLPEATGSSLPPAERPVYVEAPEARVRLGLAPHTGVVRDRWKLIDAPRPELYDLVHDPMEETDLAARHPEQVESLRSALAAFGFRTPGEPGAMPADPTVLEQLEALGYTHGVALHGSNVPLPDPKDHAQLITRSQRVRRLADAGRTAEALTLLDALSRDHPHLLQFALRKSSMLGQAGRADEADAVIEGIAEQGRDVPEVQQALAGVRARQARWNEAVALYREAFDANPQLPRVGALAVAARLGPGGPDAASAAVSLARELAIRAPQDPALQGMLGVALARSGDIATAEAHLKNGLRAMVAEPEVAWWAGRIAEQQGQIRIARKLYERELEHHPRTMGAALDLVALLAAVEDYAAELVLARELTERIPTEPSLWHAWSQSAFNVGELAEARVALDRGLARFPRHPELVLLDANLLAREGRGDEGRRRFDEARALKEAERVVPSP